MPTLVVRLAVSLATASVVMAGIEALRVRHPRALAGPQGPDEPLGVSDDTSPRLGPDPIPMAEPAPGNPGAGRGGLFMARIHGRVVGSAEALEDLEIEIEDSSRDYDPRVEDDGTFEIDVPAGSYTISASSGTLVAQAEVAGLLESEDREVVLTLTEGVTISGRVEGCEGPCPDVSVHAQGQNTRREAEEAESDEQGEYAIAGLMPGHVYDLTFATPGRRRKVMRGIVAPRQGLLVTLEESASLAGGFGIAAGEKCPMHSVELKTGGDEEDSQTAYFDRACRFHFEDLPDVERVHITADGQGWHFEQDVTIPAHGDPPFLCLHPNCRDPEPEVKASLEVQVNVPSNHPFFIRALVASERGAMVAGCDSPRVPCVVENLRPVRDAKVEVYAIGCEVRTYTVDINPGKNYLTSPCEAVREVQGVIRGGFGKNVLEHAHVRCSSEHPGVPTNGRFFTLLCPERLSAIEYRLGGSDTWQSAAVMPDGDEGDTFVDIDAG